MFAVKESALAEPNEEEDVVALNEELYSRQLYVLGAAAQRKLQRAKVLVSGKLSGLGAELCKNVVLAGVNSICLHDDSLCEAADLSSAGFLIKDADVSKGVERSAAMLDELRDMNTNVSVTRISGKPDFRAYDVVVLINPSKEQAMIVSSLLRSSDSSTSKTRLIVTGAYGLFAYTFSDFGNYWEISDVDGEVVKSGLVLSASAPNAQELEMVTEFPHRLSEGDWVKFTCEGFSAPRPVKLVHVSKGKMDENRFRISIGSPDEQQQEPFSNNNAKAASSPVPLHSFDGSYFEQVKRPEVIKSHIPLHKSMEDPRIVHNSFEDETKPKRLFALLSALWTFEEAHKRLPEPGLDTDAEFVLNVVERRCALTKEERDEMRALASAATGTLSPIAAFMGGVAGQEVLKACTGKFMPLDQWLLFSATECVPCITAVAPKPTFTSKTFSRYQGQATVFGFESQKKLGALKILVVGAGALGCEILKSLSLMGVSTHSEGGVTYVTDPDGIEMSNLNRQFLFRSQSVGKNKAITAAEATKKMNPDFNIKAFQERVSAENDSGLFTDGFWDSLDLVINALDNVPSRMFVDSQCVYYGKPLLESGTLGTKANTLPVIPNLTESYGSDPVKDFDSTPEIPACTLHAYPNLFEHTLTWARDAVFERDFVMDPIEAKNFLETMRKSGIDEYVQQLQRQPNSMGQKLRSARMTLWGIEPTDQAEGLFPYSVPMHFARAPASTSSSRRNFSLKDCVRLARLRFEELFANKIHLLLVQHPANSKDGDAPFWSGKRRLPAPAKFDEDDPAHLLFITSCSKLTARIHGIAVTDDELSPSAVKEMLKGTMTGISPFKPAVTNTAAPTTSSAPSETWKQDLTILRSSMDSLSATVNVEPQKFDKDDDSHIDLVWATAVIRARNYKIPTLDRMEAKRVVGRIIPAIATATAAATGLVALELYKYCLLAGSTRMKIEAFRASNFNLAVNAYASFEPKPCRVVQRAGGLDCTLWTVITLKGNLTIQQVIDELNESLGRGFQVTSLMTTGDVTLYNDLFSSTPNVLQTPVSELFRRVVGREPPQVFIPLTVDGDFDDLDDDSADGDDAETFVVPPVRLRWKDSK